MENSFKVLFQKKNKKTVTCVELAILSPQPGIPKLIPLDEVHL